MSRGRGRVALAALVLLGIGCRGRACTRESAPPLAASAPQAPAPSTSALPEIVVPRATAKLTLDGELAEESWRQRSARTPPFRDGAGEVRPYSDARFLRDDEVLYVALYAADEDIHASVTAHDGPAWLDDAFTTRWSPAASPGTTLLLDVSASGALTDAREANGHRDVSWESGAKLGVDRDGTPNDSRDLDEEWIVEMAIPLKALGGAPGRVDATLARCDTPKSGGKRCGQWRGIIVLE